MAGLSQDMSEDDGGLPSHDWTTHGGGASPGASDSEQDPADPSAPSQPIQKRRRVTRACDECRRKKIKCDGKQPCTHCSVYSYECTYDKPSNRRRNPAPQYIEALEGRLQRAETLLRKFMPDVDLADPNLDPAVQQEFHNREQTRARVARQHGGPSNVPPPSSSDSNDAQIVSMIDSTGQLDIDDKGGWDFHGISSGSMFLKRMKEHFRGKLGPSAKLPFTTKPERPTVGLANLDPPTPVGQSPFSSVSNYAELPSKEVTRNLCYYSLGCATCLVRIVHVPSFYEKLDKIYDRPVESLNQEETHFLGLVYAVLALGCMYESLDEQNSHKMSVKEAMDEGMKYYKSARALIQDITQCRDLTSLQALLFIILFLQATSNMSACYTFVGIALRSALHMGLHRHLKHDQIDTIEDETRRRVFYVIRQMDIYLSTLLGFPLMLNADDVDQPFPTEVDDKFVTHNMILQPPPGSSSFYVAFNAHTRLMEILAKITKYVYPMKGSESSIKRQKSAAASTYSISYSRIKEIEGELQQWFERLPETWRPSPEGPIEVVRVRHLLRFVYAHVQLVLYRPFLHYVSPRLSQGTKIDELSYACAAAAISVSRNIVHIGLEIRKQRVLSGPYWFMLYTEFFAVLSLVFYAIENPEKPGSAEVLADAQAGRKMIAELADKSLAAERVTKSLQVLFEQLPEKLDPANHKTVQSKKRSAQNSGKSGPIPMFSTGRQSSVSSQRTGDLARARNGGRTAPAYSTPASRGSGDAVPSMSEQRFQDPSFTGMPDLLAFDMSSRATSGSPSTASSSQQPYAIQQQGQSFNGRNPVNKLDHLMFPSEDPFAYPNQPMMELGYQPPPPVGQQQAQGSQFFMPGSMDDVDSQLLGQPPPYAIQHPEGQPGLEFSANMFDPMYNVPMSGQQSHSQPPSTSSQSIHSTISQGRRVHPRRQERQIDQMFDQNGMQADWGGFFGSGRGVFQGM